MVQPARPVFVFDIDGTLTSEQYYNDSVRELEPYVPMVTVCQGLAKHGEIVIVSARPHYLLPHSEYWLQKHKIPYIDILHRGRGEDEDEDFVVRVRQVNHVKFLWGRVDMVFDDLPRNCEALVQAGFPVAMVRQ